MFKILGISHFVFSVNNDKQSIYLRNNYLAPDNFKFDHSSVRRPMLRNTSNQISNIKFFKPINQSLPPIELIGTNNSVSRKKNSFGIIDKTHENTSSPNVLIQFGNQQSIQAHFCPAMGVSVCSQTDIIDNDHGCWIKVFDFKSQLDFLKKKLNLNCFYEDDFSAKFRTRIINKSLTPFTIVLIKASEPDRFYNDDLGFSSIGWFSRNLISFINSDHYKISEHFKLKLYDKELNAQFVYDNGLFSHEILKLNI